MQCKAIGSFYLSIFCFISRPCVPLTFGPLNDGFGHRKFGANWASNHSNMLLKHFLTLSNPSEFACVFLLDSTLSSLLFCFVFSCFALLNQVWFSNRWSMLGLLKEIENNESSPIHFHSKDVRVTSFGYIDLGASIEVNMK